MIDKLYLILVVVIKYVANLLGLTPIQIQEQLSPMAVIPTVVTPARTETDGIIQLPSQNVTLIPSKKPTYHPKPTARPTVKSIDNSPWGVAQQIGEHTWTMKIGEDKEMGSPKEVFEALNEYRRRNGKPQLAWDDRLRDYAQLRADYFYQTKGLDEHRGFMDYLQNQDGFNKIGFDGLGENSSYGYKLSGVHLIEWIFAGDKPHDDNQLNNDWAYVGVGIKGSAVDIIFGTGRR